MLRRILRWLTRAVATIVVLFLVALVVDYFTHRVRPDSILLIKLTGPVVERGTSNWFGALRGEEETPLNVVRTAIHNAERDPRITGLALKVIDPTMEMAQAQELSTAVSNFAKKGKWTAAYIETAGEFEPGNLVYTVASSANKVSMMPQGELNLVGLQMREIFLRGALDWIGVKPDLYAFGKYKTAANMFTDKDFTPPQREADESLIGNLFEQLTSGIAAHRHLEVSAVRTLVDRAPLSARDGIRARLIDRVEYEDEFDDRIEHQGGTEHQTVDYQSYARPRLPSGFHSVAKIGVVYATGEIDRGRAGYGPTSPGEETMGSETMAEAFEQVREDDSIRAVILRINSPGGSVVASELIRREAELTARKKPLVVSMSGYAASGGYWISTPATKVFADPGTITGSIGVLGGKFNVAAAVAKLHINTGAVSQGRNVSMFDSFTDFTPDQSATMQNKLLGEVYKEFVERVAQSRHLSVSQVEKVAQGRVWTGEQALSFKLVDKLGDFDDALKEAKAEAKLPPDQPVQLVSVPRQPSLLQSLSGLGTGANAIVGRSVGNLAAPLLRILQQERVLNGSAGALYCAHLPLIR